MVLIGVVLGCSGEPELRLVEDTSYREFTELQQVWAECGENDAIVVRARTKGWTEEAQVEIWGAEGSGSYTLVNLDSVAFRRDEYCDIVEGTTAGVEPTGPPLSCASDLEAATYLVRIQFEVGCGGMKAWGDLADAVYLGDVSPIDSNADCGLTEDSGYNPADYIMGEHTEVDPCSVPVP